MRDCHPDRLMPCFQQALGLAGEGDVGVVINYLLAPPSSGAGNPSSVPISLCPPPLG